MPMIRFKHKKPLVRVRKWSGFGLKYLVLSPQMQLDMFLSNIKNIAFCHHKHTYKGLDDQRLVLPWTWLEMSRRLIKHNTFCHHKHDWKCHDISSKTPSYAVTNTAVHVPKYITSSYQVQKYNVFLPEMSWQLAKNTGLYCHEHDK